MYFTEHYDRGYAWYSAQFAAASPGQLLGEATADYLARRPALVRLGETAPEVRLIASIRNPVDRAWSHYWLLRARERDHRSFEEAVEEELEAYERQGIEAPTLLYLLHGLYDVHLAGAIELFSRPSVHISVFEEMATDPAATYRNLCAFLAVSEDFVPQRLGDVVNAYVDIRSVKIRTLAKRLPVPAKRLVDRLNTRTKVSYPEMAAEVRATLEEFYAPHNAALEELLGRRLPWD
jgi:hypothetical protein